MAVAKVLTCITNFIAMLAGLLVVAIGVWLVTKKDGSQCVSFFSTPVLVVGSVIFVVALMGFIGAAFEVTILLWFYLLVMFLAMIALLVFTVFAFVVTNAKAGEVVSGQGFKNYRLGDYNGWLQRRVNNTQNWATISSCIGSSTVCEDLAVDYLNSTSLFAANLSPIEAGCCIPPRDCGFTFSNATYWTGANTNTTDGDCPLWSNNQTLLCTGCSTCKAGVLQNVKNDWKTTAITNCVAFVIIFVVYSVGCCAYRGVKRDRRMGYVKDGF